MLMLALMHNVRLHHFERLRTNMVEGFVRIRLGSGFFQVFCHPDLDNRLAGNAEALGFFV